MLGGLGTAVAAIRGGLPWAVGFLFGTVFSGGSFWFWHRTVKRIGENSSPTMMAGLRYLVFLSAGYVIFNFSEASLLAALAGCLVAAAAVILEILFELIYGT